MTCSGVCICGSRFAQGRHVGVIAAHVAHRLDEALALVGRQIVLRDGVGKRVPLDRVYRGGETICRGSMVRFGQS
jgi:hypothetical protein